MTTFKVDRIQIPSSTVPGETPTGTLAHGELWVNTADKVLFAGVDNAPPVQLSASGTAPPPSSFDAGTYV